MGLKVKVKWKIKFLIKLKDINQWALDKNIEGFNLRISYLITNKKSGALIREKLDFMFREYWKPLKNSILWKSLE